MGFPGSTSLPEHLGNGRPKSSKILRKVTHYEVGPDTKNTRFESKKHDFVATLTRPLQQS